MHYIGKEQHHGYENRLTPDIYPADFGWTVNWDKPDERQEWFHNMSSVLQAGVAVRTNQLDYDEEVIFKSTQYLYDYVRSPPDERRPFFLTVSMTHPHDPYAISKKYWDRYEGVDIPAPKVAAFDQEKQDAHSQRLLKCVDLWDNPLPEDAILRARRAYFGACSYVDDQVGKLREVLSDCGLADDTIVVFTSDHGDMLGERGLWYKMSWFENSARVPLVVHHPASFAPRRVPENVSTMDLLPSFVDMVRSHGLGTASSRSSLSEASSLISSSSSAFPVQLDLLDDIDGKSFYPALYGVPISSEVFGEYMGEGTVSPLVMIKRNNYKFIYTAVDEPQLFDIDTDPLELQNLYNSQDTSIKSVAENFLKELNTKWDIKQIHRQALRSQRQRRICWQALRQGTFESWDYEPKDIAGGRYIRSNIPLDDLERRARYPAVDEHGRIVSPAKLPISVAVQNSLPVLYGQAYDNKGDNLQLVQVLSGDKTGEVISVVSISPSVEA
jgi:choline-sulfatase